MALTRFANSRCGFMLISLAVLFTSLNMAATDDDLRPFFTIDPEPLTAVGDNENVTLTCLAGPPGVNIRWTLNNEPINDWQGISVHGGHLFIRSFVSSPPSMSHAGIYTCVAYNSLGAVVSRPGKLISTSELTQIEEDEASANISILSGETALIPCSLMMFKQSFNISVEYEYNGATLLMTDRHKISPLSGTLHIVNTSDKDKGIYRCSIIFSMSGRTIKSKKIINLHTIDDLTEYIPPTFTWTTPTHVKIIVGDDLALECAASGRPTPHTSWLRYGGQLPQERLTTFLNGLIIKNVQPLDAGTYICTAENSDNKPATHIVFMEVLEKPVVVGSPSDVRLAAGTRAEFRCKVRGLPTPVLTWLHDAQLVMPSQSVSLMGTSLILNDVANIHSGMYQCIAANSIGIAMSSARLMVLFGIPSSASTEQTPILPSTKLSRRRPNPPVKQPLSRRHKDNGRRQGQRRKILDLDDLSAGKEKRNITVPGRKEEIQLDKLLRTRLIPPEIPKVKLLSDSAVRLRWTPLQPSGSLQVSFVKIQFKEFGRGITKGWRTIEEDISGTTQAYKLSGLTPGNTYQFRLVAVYSNNDNKHGDNTGRVLMSVTGQPRRAQLTVPVIVEARAVSDTNIRISWHYIPNGRLVADGFMIFYGRYEHEDKTELYVNVTAADVTGRQSRTGEYHLTLHDLAPGAAYNIRMRSFNVDGMSEFSKVVVAETKASGNDSGEEPISRNVSPVQSSFSTTHLPVAGNAHDVRVSPNDEKLFVILGVIVGAVVVIIVVVAACCICRYRHLRNVAYVSRANNDKSLNDFKRSLCHDRSPATEQKVVNKNSRLLVSTILPDRRTEYDRGSIDESQHGPSSDEADDDDEISGMSITVPNKTLTDKTAGGSYYLTPRSRDSTRRSDHPESQCSCEMSTGSSGFSGSGTPPYSDSCDSDGKFASHRAASSDRRSSDTKSCNTRLLSTAQRKDNRRDGHPYGDNYKSRVANVAAQKNVNNYFDLPRKASFCRKTSMPSNLDSLPTEHVSRRPSVTPAQISHVVYSNNTL